MARYEISSQEKGGAYPDGVTYTLRDGARQAEAIIVPELGCNCIEFRTTPDGDPTPADSAHVVDVFVPPVECERTARRAVYGRQPDPVPVSQPRPRWRVRVRGSDVPHG